MPNGKDRVTFFRFLHHPKGMAADIRYLDDFRPEFGSNPCPTENRVLMMSVQAEMPCSPGNLSQKDY